MSSRDRFSQVVLLFPFFDLEPAGISEINDSLVPVLNYGEAIVTGGKNLSVMGMHPALPAAFRHSFVF
jgi:hypothetical protein